MATFSNSVSVYVGTYSKYNNGNLAGEWIDITDFLDWEEFVEYCKNIHSDEDEPELMYQDFENFPNGIELCEDTFELLQKYANHENKDALDAFIKIHGYLNFDEFDEKYQGEFNSKEDFARHLVNECYDIERTMGNLSYYFDYNAFARDIFVCDYDYSNGYVFRSY